jgi:hypothetical protein
MTNNKYLKVLNLEMLSASDRVSASRSTALKDPGLKNKHLSIWIRQGLTYPLSPRGSAQFRFRAAVVLSTSNWLHVDR